MGETSRIKDIAAELMTPAQTQAFQEVAAGRGRLPTPYKIWIHSAGVASAMGKLGNHLNNEGALTERELELVICMISSHWQADYVWTNHVKHGIALGFATHVFDAIDAGRAPALDDEREQAVYELARAAMRPGGGPDAAFDRAEKLIGRDGIAEVLALLGYFTAVSMGMKLHRVPIK